MKVRKFFIQYRQTNGPWQLSTTVDSLEEYRLLILGSTSVSRNLANLSPLPFFSHLCLLAL